jgi:excisionase family DNA binding protein
MLTVPEAARRAGKNPETVRRWIREGKLPARKIGTQHVIAESDLQQVVDASRDGLRLPANVVRRSHPATLSALMADGRVTPAINPDTDDLPLPVVAASPGSATSTLLAERATDRR